MRALALTGLIVSIALAAQAAESSSAVDATTAFTKQLMAKEKSKPVEPAPVAAVEKPKKAKKPGVVYPAMTKEEQRAEGKVKSLKGKVSGINNFGLAVEYGAEGKVAREMWADLMKETKLEGVKSLKELNYGDEVELTYKEIKSNSKRLLLKARLVRRAPQETQSDDKLKATE
jgi:hypothetical protein